MTLMDGELPVVVVGAGIIGLSIARELSERGGWCVVLEARPAWGEGASSRNSEVLHGGFLYAAGSLKQRCCLVGRQELSNRLELWDVPVNRCGKLVVAVEPDEVERLDELLAESARIGVPAQRVEVERARELEPALTGELVAAGWFPESAVFDTHTYMQRLLDSAQENGSHLLVDSPVQRLCFTNGSLFAELDGEQVEASALINTSGMDADRLLAASGVDIGAAGLEQEAWAGRWYRLRQSQAEGMNRLVYRTSRPGSPGLGVHTTPDAIADGVRLGPDAVRVPNLTSDFEQRHRFADDEQTRRKFLERLLPLYPHLTTADLTPDQVGLRNRAFDEQGRADHRFIDGESVGLPRTLHLLGIESPGVTGSPEIARRAVDWLERLP
ncbi:MAG: hypothetical protein CXX72_00015 [Methanobacteriota archaeon]|nr:MAG: hypothetical protein CXX72_00015 [Euryarchaeota archaeon]